MQFLILLSAVIAVSFADHFDPCVVCDPNPFGIGYAPSANCNQFYKCQQLPGGGFYGILMCCPDGMVWDFYLLTCMPGDCYEEDFRDDNCPPSVDSLGNKCYLLPHKNGEMFYMINDGALEEMHCAPQTHYDHENCTCVHGGLSTCDDDPMLYFPFGNHDDDVQCMNAEGFSHGDAHLNAANGAVCFDGNGDFVEVPFLASWFNGFVGSFTVSLWFYQEKATEPNYFPEGLFSNADCFFIPTVTLGLLDGVSVGAIFSDTDNVFFTPGDFDAMDRAYSFGVWNQVAMRYDSGVVSYFFNGEWISDRFLPGDILNSHGPATIGMINLGIPFYFTGCIDDVMVFDRYVSNDEMKNGVFAHVRTVGNLETPY